MQVINDVTIFDILDGDIEANCNQVKQIARDNTQRTVTIAGRNNFAETVNNPDVLDLITDKEFDNIAITPQFLPYLKEENFVKAGKNFIKNEFMAIVGYNSNRIERAAHLLDIIKDDYNIDKIDVLNYKALIINQNGKNKFATLDGDGTKDEIIKINYSDIINLNAAAEKLPADTFILVGNRTKRVAPEFCEDNDIHFVDNSQAYEFKQDLLKCDNSIPDIGRTLRKWLDGKYTVNYAESKTYGTGPNIGFTYEFDLIPNKSDNSAEPLRIFICHEN